MNPFAKMACPVGDPAKPVPIERRGLERRLEAIERDIEAARAWLKYQNETGEKMAFDYADFLIELLDYRSLTLEMLSADPRPAVH